MAKAKSEAKPEKYPIHILSLDQIKVDHGIQSRVETSKEFEREFAEAMLRGDQFPPITVFFDGQDYWLSDGFHRFGATCEASRLDLNLKGIRAEVRNGTRRDAIIFSAGANQKFSIPRTKEDIKKAIWMLLDDDKWFEKSDPLIAEHCGVSPPTVKRHRVDYCNSRKTPMPKVTVSRSGILKSTTADRQGTRPPKVYGKSGGKGYRATIFGREVILGHDPEKAKQKAEEIWKDDFRNRDSGSFRHKINNSITKMIERRNVKVISFSIPQSTCPGLYGFSAGDKVCTWEDFSISSQAVAAIGRALLLKLQTGSVKNPVIICYPDEGPGEILALGRKLGVEFLTPEELLASIKGEESRESA